MKKLITAIVILIIITLMLFGFSEYSAQKSRGFYRSLTGTIYCSDYSSCIHEIGHKTDDEHGWISKSYDWQRAVDYYRIKIYYYPETRNKISADIEFFYGIGWKRFQGTNNNIFAGTFWEGWGGYTELYAYILELSDGKQENIPEELRGFYDWDRIDELMKIYTE